VSDHAASLYPTWDGCLDPAGGHAVELDEGRGRPVGEEAIRAKPQLCGFQLRQPSDRCTTHEVCAGEEPLPLAPANQSSDCLVAEPPSLGLRPSYDAVLPPSLDLAAPDGGSRAVHEIIKSHAGTGECGRAHVYSEKFSVLDNFSESSGDALVLRPTTMEA
jgi:hypothetical protein